MTTQLRIIIVVAMVAAVAGVLYVKAGEKDTAVEQAVAMNPPDAPADASADPAPSDTAAAAETSTVGKAKLMCFGAERCVPCRMMIPVREALAEAYPDTLIIEFVDVWKDRSAGERSNIRVIPTAIFINAEGNEVYRQEGYMDKDTIVAKFKEHGVSLEKEG